MSEATPEKDEAKNPEAGLEQARAVIESLKGKNSANSQQKKEFTQLWLSAAREKGLTDDVIDALAEGINISHAEPLHTFLLENPSKSNVERVRMSRLTRAKDQDVALKLYISLLGFELVQPSSDACAPMIISVIPNVAKNKENKVFGTIAQTVKKYLIDPLGNTYKKNHNSFPSIALPAKPELSTILLPPLDELGTKRNLRSEQMQAIFWLKAWLEKANHPTAKSGDVTVANNPSHESKSSPSTETASKLTTAGKKPAVPQALAKPAGSTASTEPAASAAPSASESTKISAAPKASVAPTAQDAPAAPAAPTIKEVIAALRMIDEELRNSKAQVEKLQRQLDEERVSSERLRGLVKSSQTEATELKRKLEGSEQQVNNLSFENTKADERVQELQSNLDEANKMIDALSKSGSRESDEAMRRLTSKLRVDYQDYLDAVELPMTVELGENMRFQLESVFKTLKSFGLQL